MRIMYCYIEPWILKQNIYLMSDGQEATINAKIDLDQIPEYLASAYAFKECDKILLHGSTPALTNKYAEDILSYGLTNFALNNINLEVVK